MLILSFLRQENQWGTHKLSTLFLNSGDFLNSARRSKMFLTNDACCTTSWQTCDSNARIRSAVPPVNVRTASQVSRKTTLSKGSGTYPFSSSRSCFSFHTSLIRKSHRAEEKDVNRSLVVHEKQAASTFFFLSER